LSVHRGTLGKAAIDEMLDHRGVAQRFISMGEKHHVVALTNGLVPSSG
jgi:hypothetical protein